MLASGSPLPCIGRRCKIVVSSRAPVKRPRDPGEDQGHGRRCRGSGAGGGGGPGRGWAAPELGHNAKLMLTHCFFFLLRITGCSYIVFDN